MIIDQKNYSQITKFVFVGILNTAIGYPLFALFIYLKIPYLISLTISHILGTVHSYIWNRYFTFHSKRRVLKEFQRFFLVYLAVYIINFVLLYIAVDILKFIPLIAQIPILLIAVTTSFIGQKLFTFDDRA